MNWTPLRVGHFTIVSGHFFANYSNTDRKNVTNFLYLVLHLAGKVTCYFRLFSSVLVSVLRTIKSKNYVKVWTF